MRNNILALKRSTLDYAKTEHSTLFKNMRLAERDHYHLREGYKEDMSFIAIIKADLRSQNKKLIGQIGGRDDELTRKIELLNINFEVELSPLGKILIDINSSDRTTTYEESLKLVHYCLCKMSKNSIEITKLSSGGNGKNKKGFYPQSAMNTGRFNTFKKTFNKAVDELVLPEDFKSMFIESNYNLVYYKG